MSKTNATGRSLAAATPAIAAAAKPAAAAATPTATDGDATPAPAPKVNPFATLPTVRATVTGNGTDFEVQDLRTVTDVANPRKYAAVQAAATERNSHMKPGWKHERDVFKIGSNRNDKRAGSVMGNIQQIVRGYGAEGCPAPALVTRLRTMSYDNTRSHFCAGKLPPVGWAEDYVRGAISDGLIKVSGQIQHDLVPVVAAPAEPEATTTEAAATPAAAKAA